MKRKGMRRIVYALCFFLLFQLAGITVFADSLIPAGENTTVARSDNNNLSALDIVNGTLVPAFNADQTEYVVVSEGIGDSITVTGVAEYAEANVSIINDVPVSSNIGSNKITVEPTPGESSVDFVVTAEDGSKKSYHILVYNDYCRADQNPNVFTFLDVSDGSLTPVFYPTLLFRPYYYAVQVGNEVSKMNLSAEVSRIYSTPNEYLHEAYIYFDPRVADAVYPADGAVLSRVFLDVGFNKFEIQVSEGMCFNDPDVPTPISSYYIIVFREAAPGQLSNNNNLSGLTISEGTLTPEFDAEKLAYIATVTNDTSAITVTGTAADSKATVSVDGGSASKEIVLNEKVTEITIVVTGEDKKVKTYTVRVTKEAKKSTGRAHPLVSERTVGGRTIARFDDSRFGLIVQRDESGLVDYRVPLRSRANDVRLQIPYADVMTKTTKGARDLVMSYQGHEIRIPMAVFEGDWLASMPCETESTFEIHLAVDEAGRTTYTIDFFVIEQINEKTRLVHRRTVQ